VRYLGSLTTLDPGDEAGDQVVGLRFPTTGRLGPAIHPAVQYSGNVDSIGQGSAGYQATKSASMSRPRASASRKAA